MNLLPDAGQQEVVDAAASFLAKELPAGRVRSLAAAAGEGGDGASVDRELWGRMGALGWFALGVPDDLGGAGYGIVEEVLLFRELGRALAPGPFVGQVLAAHLAGGARSGAFSAIAAGEVVVGLAEPYGDDRWGVVDGAGAEMLLAVSPEGVRLVGAPATGEPASAAGGSLDPLSTLSFVDLGGAPSVAGLPVSADGVRLLVARGQVLVAAMLVGMCEATRDESAAYAKDRVQFGKPIGTFQAVKHRCADMAVRAEAAGSLTVMAALSLRDEIADAPKLVAQAKALASEYALASAADNIQNHGGTGFTADCNAHLYLKRANILASVLGSPACLWPETVR
jgi:alkylation response protein AidB-like acyl-CoA dehydrogenase